MNDLKRYRAQKHQNWTLVVSLEVVKSKEKYICRKDFGREETNKELIDWAKEVEFRGNYETDGFIFVRQTQPLPFTILSLYPRLVTNDG